MVKLRECFEEAREREPAVEQRQYIINVHNFSAFRCNSTSTSKLEILLGDALMDNVLLSTAHHFCYELRPAPAENFQ